MLAGLVLAVAGVAVVTAVVLTSPDDSDVAHLEEVVREVAAIAELPVTSVDATPECSSDSAGERAPRFVVLTGPVMGEAESFADELAGRLEDAGYDDVERVGQREVRAALRAVTVQVIVGDQSTQMRAIDPVSAC